MRERNCRVSLFIPGCRIQYKSKPRPKREANPSIDPTSVLLSRCNSPARVFPARSISRSLSKLRERNSAKILFWKIHAYTRNADGTSRWFRSGGGSPTYLGQDKSSERSIITETGCNKRSLKIAERLLYSTARFVIYIVHRRSALDRSGLLLGDVAHDDGVEVKMRILREDGGKRQRQRRSRALLLKPDCAPDLPSALNS